MAFLPRPPQGGALGLPGALLLVAGLAIVYFTLRWRDEKHNTFGGFFADNPLIPGDIAEGDTDTGTNTA